MIKVLKIWNDLEKVELGRPWEHLHKTLNCVVA